MLTHDSNGEEAPRAYVVPRQPDSLTSAQVHKFVNERVSRTKRLDGGVVFVESIPRNAPGKILRKDLRERAKIELAAENGMARL